MKVGVYVDGFNLYFGARAICGRSTPGWRWLDLRSLVTTSLPRAWRDRGAVVERVVYCTAHVSGDLDPTSPTDQAVYLQALLASGSVDHIEYGTFVSRVKTSPLAIRKGPKQAQIVHADWPVKIQGADGTDVPDAKFLVSHLHTEEKGSDVNVAAHLLLDVLDGAVDAAIVLSNDSDLALPIRMARDRIAVGVVNPGSNYRAGALAGQPDDGVGGHWWGRVSAEAYRAHQLPDPVAGEFAKPPGW